MSTRPTIVIERVKFPAIGLPKEPRPDIPARVFAARLARTRRRMAARGLDALVVYGDREHFATLAYLTNYDPRFEESLLVILPTGRPILFVGNEGMGYSNVARLDVERRLCQTLSLLGQTREQARPFHLMLKETGLQRCRRVGAVGWKYFTEREVEGGAKVLDLPEFMAASLRKAVPKSAAITNETAMFMDPETGLRNLHEPEQLAYFEWIGALNSATLLKGIRAVRPGISELELFAKMPSNGTPFSCSPVVLAGEGLRRMLIASPTPHRIRKGEPLLMTYAYQGADVCRFGWVARGPRDLPSGVKDYVERAVFPYFDSLVAWYDALRIGATGDELHRVVADRLKPLGFKLALNIGHQIAMEEWTHSLVSAGSTQRIRSGMYWQSDFFAALPTAHFGAFAEDGVAVADARLRKTLAARYPEMWARIQARRRFMIRTLGYRLADELLPFSDFCGAVTPYMMAPTLCPVVKRSR